MLSKERFGSAGCNVNVEPVLSVFDTSAIPVDASGSITYEITGGDDGPVIETIDISRTQYTPERNVISTSSSSKKLAVKITDVQTNSQQTILAGRSRRSSVRRPGRPDR